MWKIAEALRKMPSLLGWLESIIYVTIFLLASFFTAPHLYDFSNAVGFPELALVGVIAFFVPSLFEELVFRGLLLPDFSARWVVLSLGSFVLWHPLESLTFFPEARAVFTDPTFLLLVTLLGVLCTLAYFRTGSLWASIFVHWAVVVAWKAAGGARFIG